MGVALLRTGSGRAARRWNRWRAPGVVAASGPCEDPTTKFYTHVETTELGGPVDIRRAQRGPASRRAPPERRTGPAGPRGDGVSGRLGIRRPGPARLPAARPAALRRRPDRPHPRPAPRGAPVRPVRRPADPGARGAVHRLRPGAAGPARPLVRDLARRQGRLAEDPRRAQPGAVDGDRHGRRRGAAGRGQAPPAAAEVRLPDHDGRDDPAGRARVLPRRRAGCQALDPDRRTLLRTRRVRQGRHRGVLRRLPDRQPGRARAHRPQGVGPATAARPQPRPGAGDLGGQPAGAGLRTRPRHLVDLLRGVRGDALHRHRTHRLGADRPADGRRRRGRGRRPGAARARPGRRLAAPAGLLRAGARPRDRLRAARAGAVQPR